MSPLKSCHVPCLAACRRENGGNCDIKNLSRGCRVYFPVFVEGAKLSMGDMHFSQGDGEVSFCGAIEMSGFLELRQAARCPS
jgi:formamidase